MITAITNLVSHAPNFRRIEACGEEFLVAREKNQFTLLRAIIFSNQINQKVTQVHIIFTKVSCRIIVSRGSRIVKASSFTLPPTYNILKPNSYHSNLLYPISLTNPSQLVQQSIN